MTESENGVICQKCGTKNKPGAKFCTSCGASFEKSISVCPSCGKPVSPEDVFCGYCGTHLESLSSEQVTEVPRAGEATSLPEDAERKVIRGAELFSILGLAGVLLIVLGPYYYANFHIITSLFSDTGITVSLFYVQVFLIAGMIIVMSAVLFIRDSYHRLSQYDYVFSRPAILTIFLVLAMIVTAGFLGYVTGSTVLYGNTPNGYNLLFVQFAIYGLIFSVLVVIFLIIGFIGLLMGLWRLGRKLGRRSIMASAFLYLLLILGLGGSSFYVGVYPLLIRYDVYAAVLCSAIISALIYAGSYRTGKELSRNAAA